MAKHNIVGKIGEDIAEKWLISNSFEIIERNYRKKWGEIDIIAREAYKVHFVEVKSVSYGTKADLEHAVSHETWRPEENVHSEKIRRMKNAIQTWILEKKYKSEFSIDIVMVRLVPDEKYAQVEMLENVIFE